MQLLSPRPASDIDGLDMLVEMLTGKRIAVLTGAGCSTESGIPDYRGPETRRKARNPIQYRAFTKDPLARQRYWARSLRGWPRFSAARPNDGHRALAALESSGLLTGIVTQNVDRLHQAAGSRRVVELHGALSEVRCLSCEAISRRAELQERLLALNPEAPGSVAVELAPDGDAELEAAATRSFVVAGCDACGGVLKPNVVFFGENVPRPVVDRAFEIVDEAEVLLVVGSSLAVFSGFRFVRHAAKHEMPVAMVNLGETRGDPLSAIRVAAPAGSVLTALAQRLSES